MKYDVIFADLDGTLLRDDKSVPESNLKAIKDIINSGAEFVVCSGRSYMSLKNINKQLFIDNIEGYCISFNGGSVFERKSNEILFEHKMDKNTAKEILSFCKNFDVDIMFYADSMLWVDKISPNIITYSKHSVILPKRVKNIVRSCNSSVNKVILIGNNNILKEIQTNFNNNKLSENVDCCFSADNLLEFNSCDIDKGTGVNYIMGLDKFKGKKSLAIGDNYNDIPMFKACDFSIAVKGSDKEVINAADTVSKNTNNDGILAEILEKYIL